MLGHRIEQFHVRGTEHWMEGESATQVGKGGGFLRAGGSQLSVEGKGKGCRSHEVPGWGHLACEQSVESQARGCDVGLYG